MKKLVMDLKLVEATQLAQQEESDAINKAHCDALKSRLNQSISKVDDAAKEAEALQVEVALHRNFLSADSPGHDGGTARPGTELDGGHSSYSGGSSGRAGRAGFLKDGTFTFGSHVHGDGGGGGGGGGAGAGSSSGGVSIGAAAQAAAAIAAAPARAILRGLRDFIVIYDYNPATAVSPRPLHVHELYDALPEHTLREGDVVTVDFRDRRAVDGYHVGRLRGVVGLVPTAFIEPVAGATEFVDGGRVRASKSNNTLLNFATT